MAMAAPPSTTSALTHPAHARPTAVRRPTSQILSYYQSEAANTGDGDVSYAYQDDKQEDERRVSWSKRNEEPSASRSDSGSSVYSGADNGTRQAPIRGSAMSEGLVEYGIALGTPSGLLDRPGSSFFGSIKVPVPPTPRAADETGSKSMTSATVQAPALGHRRRKSVRSSGGSDKRRVAVVEMDSASEAEGELADGESRARPRAADFTFPSSSTNTSSSSTTHTTSYSTDTDATNGSITSTNASSLLSRRGLHHHKVALLAPPDASPSTLANLSYLSPPLSAPPVSTPSDRLDLSPPTLRRNESSNSNISSASVTSSVRQHQRSQSEAVLIAGRTSSSPLSGLGLGHPRSPRSESTTRQGHKPRNSSRDIGIVGAHLHSFSPPPTAQPDVNEHTMQVEVRPLDESRSNPSRKEGPSSQHTQQLSPIFQRPSLSQASSYVSSVGSDGQLPGTVSADQHTGVFSVFKDSNRRTLTQQQLSSVPNGTSTIGETSANDDSRHPREHDHTSNNQNRHVPSPSGISGSVSASAASNGHTTSSSLPQQSRTPPVTQPSNFSTPSQFLYYQPGVHATAGPLPQPPQQVHPDPESKKDTTPPSKPSTPTPISAGGSAPPRPPRLHAPRDAGSLSKKRSEGSLNTPTERNSLSSSAGKPAPEARSGSTIVTPSSTSTTLVNSYSGSSVKGMHQREGAFPMHSLVVQDSHTLPRSHEGPSNPTDAEEKDKDKLIATSATDLKRANTMDNLVKDVTAAIDEISLVKGPKKPQGELAAQNGHALARKRSATAAGTSGSGLERDNDATPRRIAMDEKPQRPPLSSHRSAADLRREGSRSTFKSGRKSAKDGSDSDYSDDDYENITVSRAPTDPQYHVRSPGMHGPSASMSDSGHGSGGSLKGSHSPHKILDFAAAMKRFSALPRTPSRLSVSRASQHSGSLSHEQHISPSISYTPLPPIIPPKSIHYAPKVKSAWPEAMRFNEVLIRRSPLERSLAYARKINELANHDPGLEDWVISTKENCTKRKSMTPAASRRSPAEQTTFQPRHASRGSIGSEMTFPKRVDAYVATDLLPHKRSEENLPRGPPTALPYPTLPPAPIQHSNSVTAVASALLHQTSTSRQLPFGVRNIPVSLALSRSGSSANGSTASASGSGSTGGGFFSSIGRKTSIKRDRPLGTGSSLSQPNKLLSKRQPQPPPAPKPVQISASPSLPGGPRAPPGRAPPVGRAQSVIAPKTSASALGIGAPSVSGGSASQGAETDVEPVKRRRLSIKRTGSVQPPPIPARSTTLPAASANPAPVGANVNMDAQVSKLKDLLPHAEPSILQGYLQRAGGSEMLAIGRYLDDEKNGALRRL